MIVDVIWPMRNPDALARGYGDCGLLDEILEGKVWTPQHAVRFRHHEVRGDFFPPVPGAVVIVNCRHNVDDADWLIGQIEQLGWCLLILAGDEEWNFPWHRLPPTATRRVWVQAPIPAHAGWASHMFPGGWYWRTHDEIRPHFNRYMARPLRFFFGGQVTHKRRKDCVHALRHERGGKVIQTDGFLKGVPTYEYHEILAGAKAVPSPSGPYTPDAARPLGAMEAGCVPILDMRKPLPPQFDYWRLVFGDDHPCPVVWEWAEAPQVIDKINKEWRVLHPRVFSWWQQWKRSMTHRLHDDIRALGVGHMLSTAEDKITVVVTSSPIPSHPDTSILEETLRSVRDQLPRAEIILALDGLRPEQADWADRYFEYVTKVLWKCNFEWHNVLPVVMDRWGHQANAVRRALEFVRTDTLLFIEHDTPICGDIPWNGMIKAIRDGGANMIRLHQDVEIHPDHEAILLDRHPYHFDGLPMRRSSAWWQRPHLASTRFYRDVIDGYFPAHSRTMIEDRMYGPVWSACQDGHWDDWKIWVYTPEGNIQRSRHLDGRDGAPKFEMRYG